MNVNVKKPVGKNILIGTENLAISPPKMAILHLHIRGVAPLMICRFSAKSMNSIKEKQKAGSTANVRKTRGICRAKAGTASMPLRSATRPSMFAGWQTSK